LLTFLALCHLVSLMWLERCDMSSSELKILQPLFLSCSFSDIFPVSFPDSFPDFLLFCCFVLFYFIYFFNRCDVAPNLYISCFLFFLQFLKDIGSPGWETHVMRPSTEATRHTPAPHSTTGAENIGALTLYLHASVTVTGGGAPGRRSTPQENFSFVALPLTL
jgi:hypothetical protein